MQPRSDPGHTSCPPDTLIAQYLEHALPSAVTHEVEAHVAACATCRDVLAWLERHRAPSGTQAEAAVLLQALGSELTGADAFGAGEVIGGYRLVRKVGQGGMGVVYEAYDQRLGRRVALKFVSPRFAADRQLAARLLREARAVAALHHPNVGIVYDIGEHRGQPFLVMAFHEGVTLAQRLEQGPLAQREALALVLQITDGVACAHAAGVVHRDVKPSNVMLSPSGEARVLDFGLAKLLGNSDVTATVEGELLGTVAYMSPEHLRREEVDARADVWALGVTAVELLSGLRPFAGTESVDLAHAVLHDDPLLPSRLPRDLEAILLACLAKDRERRYRDAGELATDLRRFQAGEPVTARRLRWTERVARGARRERRRLGTALAVALIAATGLQTYRATRRTPLCRGAAGKLATIWNAERRHSIETAFAATGKPFAAAASVGVLAAIDRYAKEWTAMYTDACEATHDRGEQSQDLLDLRMECLDQHREDLRAQVSQLASADARGVQRALESTAAIPSVSDCARVDELRQVVRPPNQGVRERVAALRRRLADARAVSRMGRYKEAFPLGTQLVSEARAMDYAPVLAETLTFQGNTEDSLGSTGDATQTLLQAVAAAEAARDDHQRARALTELIAVSGMSQARFSDAHTYYALAKGALSRAGGDASLSLTADDYEANALANQGRLEEAVTLEKAVLAQVIAKDGPESPSTARVLGNLGAFCGNTSRTDEALAYLERGRVLEEKIYGPQHPLVANAWANIGAFLFEKGGHDREVEAAFEKSLALREATFGPKHVATGKALHNLATLLEETNQPERALPLMRRAVEIKRAAAGDEDLAVTSSYQELGNVLGKLGHYDEALANLEKALAIRQKLLTPPNADIAETLMGIGRVHLRRKDWPRALAALEKSFAMAVSPTFPPHCAARIRFALAQALWESGRDRKRARMLAKDALPSAERYRGEIEDWLRSHA